MTSNYIHASNGLGEAVRANISEDRGIGDMQFITDSVLNWPARFIATAATLDVNGFLQDETVFFGYLAGGIIYVDHFAPGYPDVGNTTNQVIVLKPSTAWTDMIADYIDGVVGTVWHYGAGVPVDLEAEGDYYIDTDTSNVYHQVGGSWGSPILNIKGETGENGTNGTNGTNGINGATIRNGAGAPSSGLGLDGDYYINTTNDDLYFKAGGAYSVVANLKGATGATGDPGTNGTNGTNGATWRSGAGAPSDGLGVNGDYYLNTTTSDVYLKTAGIYSIVVNIKGATGDTGDTGATGAGVPTGGATDQILKKASATNYDYAWANQATALSRVKKETPSGTVNGSNTAFTTANAYIGGTLEVFINGLNQGSLVTETDPATGAFTMDAPSTGDNVQVSYDRTGTSTANADMVDNIHANATPTANQLLPLNASAKLPNTILASPVTRFVAVGGIVVVNGVDPTTTNWTAVDVTANTSATTYAVSLWCYIISATTAGRTLYIRPTGSSAVQAVANFVVRNQVINIANFNSYIVPVDANQSFDWSVNNADVSTVYVVLTGYWETVS